MPHIDIKEGLTAGVDKNGVLTGLQWRVLRQFTDDAGNVLGEVRTAVPLTEEELRAHLGDALAKQAADIAQDRVVRDGIAAERDALAGELRQLQAALSATTEERNSARAERDGLIGKITQAGLSIEALDHLAARPAQAARPQ